MRLLVTRPEPDATALKARLIAQGHEVLIEPLIEIEFDDAEPIELDGVQALIATSKNGVRALARSPAAAAGRLTPLFTVGPGTASTAKALGFEAVIAGPRNARDLVALIALGAEVNGGPLVHLAGDTLAFDVAGELRRLGFHVLEPVVYNTVVATRFSDAVAGRLRAGTIDGVLLLSPRTARVYVGLAEAGGLADACRNLIHYCLSAAVAKELQPLGATRSAVPKLPNLQEMLALTGDGARQSGPAD
jgi:uroporphyrinogen-III synthase